MQQHNHENPAQAEPHQSPSRANRGRRHRMMQTAIGMLLIAVISLASCRKAANTAPAYTDRERLLLDTTNNHTRNIDSLMVLVNTYSKQGDRCREMAALAALGHGYQTSNRYSDAVKAHQKQLAIAEELDDTLMKASALNDLGVNYRRLGLHYDGLDYHLRAVETSLLYPDNKVSRKMLKCRAIGYNGAGNVYLAIGSYQKADEMLRKALAVETRLGSHLGMNVDLSNLGIVYERRGLLDSAWTYYKESMRHSELAGSYTGKAYGHLNYGRLYALKGNYRKAISEFRKSISLLHEDRDLWLWLQPTLALADAYIGAGMADSARLQLNLAQETANRIQAREYLPKIDRIKAKLQEREGNYQEALAHYRKAEAQEDSMLNARNLFEIETLQSSISSRRQAKADEERNAELLRERWTKRVAFIVLLALSVLFAIVLHIQRLRRQNHLKLKKMSTMREHFFTNITHEFRTPLTVILGLSHDLTRDKDCPQSVREKAETIERQGGSLLALINQLLDISKVKSAVGNANWRNGDITAYMTMIAESYRDYAQSRHIDLQFTTREAIVMDFVPDYVRKVTDNLLSNAFKFTPEYGRISVNMWQKGERLFIDVADTGAGMDDDTLTHIFEPFYQAESDAKHIGTGVGLALVKQIIDSVGGSIIVESALGKGTTFHLSIPIHNEIKQKLTDFAVGSAPVQRGEEPELTDSEGDDSQCRLLIIEDNHDIAAYIGSQFDSRYAISYADNGRNGLEKAQELVPDIIITDLMMPGMDGLELCRQVRSNDITDHIPIIIVTAKITEEERIKGLEAGADAYLSKPFNADELHMRVEKLLEGRRLLQAKFAGMIQERKSEEEPEDNKTDEMDLRFLAKVSSLVNRQLDRNGKVDVSFLASAVCMSPRQFNRKINALVGYTPLAYIQRLKIKRSCNLLERNPNISMAEVAYRCGFDAYPNFVRAFKNVCGVTPTEYKKKNEL